jgi:D-xylose 1-dehydrogenase
MSFAIYPSLRERRVIVTGGASGIGAEIVRAFAAQGANVGFLDRDVEASAALVEDLAGC